jgi:Lipocalin-like domain
LYPRCHGRASTSIHRCRFDDGSIFTFRQWYNQNGQPLLNLNRYSYSTPDNHTTYGFGKGFEYTPLKTWTSPVTHRNYPLYGRLTTLFGTWYYSPVFPDYEIPLPVIPLWEAPVLVHTASLTGPVAGKAFLEVPSQLTATFPSIS